MRWATRLRKRFGTERQAGVLWVGSQPAIEAVAPDDYATSGCLISLVRRPDGKHARTRTEVPAGYEGYELALHSDEVFAKYSPKSLAFKAHEADLAAWVRHALIRRGMLGAESILTAPRPARSETPNVTPRPRTASMSAPASERPWRLWRAGEILATLEDIRPLLASWDSRTHPAQIRLQAYLSDLEEGLAELPADLDRLFLHMEIDVEKPERLQRHYDLENYLTPVVHRLGARRFRMASAVKRVGGGSRLIVGLAEPGPEPTGWKAFADRPSGSPSSTPWKHDLCDKLAAANPVELPPGPVEAHLAWQTARRLSWVNLWKPTDAMGPVLGAVDPSKPYNLNDDRITHLVLHLDSDPADGSHVRVGMWWRSV
ncbi:MAG: hypothetical protein ACR2MY_02020 [Candidatus Dormibacteria bacterium]